MKKIWENNNKSQEEELSESCGSPWVLVLLFLRALLRLADVLRGAATLRLLVVTALIEDAGQIGSVNLPELLIVIESGAQVPVFTWFITNKQQNRRTFWEYANALASMSSSTFWFPLAGQTEKLSFYIYITIYIYIY